MSKPDLYPLFLSLESFHVLILGFGEVGQRKFSLLLPAHPASILVVDPNEADASGKALLEKALTQGIAAQMSPASFVPEMLDKRQIVFICTSNHELNARVAGLCRERNILCNCTDNPPLGNCHVPAVAREGGLSAALSTGGASPVLSRRWKGELQSWLAAKAPVAVLMERLRPLVLALGLPSPSNREIFRSVACRDMEAALSTNDGTASRLLKERLPASLHDHIKDLLHDLPPHA